jgi:hypothetical protein
VVEGLTRSSSDAPIQAGLGVIRTGYLDTARVPLHKGRDFTDDDRAGSMPAAIINDTMARRYWPGSDPVAPTARLKKEDQRWMTVAGVVLTSKHMGLRAHEETGRLHSICGENTGLAYMDYAARADGGRAVGFRASHPQRDPQPRQESAGG